MIPTITTFGWVPEFARGFVRDLRPRWAFEEVGEPYEVILITDAKCEGHRRFQPFGQVPTYRDDEVSIFESGAIVLRIAERAGKLIPAEPASRMRALQWAIAALNSVEPFVMALVINDVFEAERDWSAARHAKVLEDLKMRLSDLEAALGDSTWLDGTEFTVGDLLMVSVLGGLRGTGVLEGFARLGAYVARGRIARLIGGPWQTTWRCSSGKPTALRNAACRRIGKGVRRHDRKQDRNLPVVRGWPRPRGGRVPRGGISRQPFGQPSSRGGRLPRWQAGRRTHRGVHRPGHAVRGPEWRSPLQVQRGRELPGLHRHAGGDRPLLGCDRRQWRRGEPVRLVQGQVRPILADHTTCANAGHGGSRPGSGQEGHGSDDGHETDQHRGD